MTIELSAPDVPALVEATRVMRDWQYDGASVPLHPGDLGWHWRRGAAATARLVRTWRRDGRVLAVGLLDGSVLRLGIAPDTVDDDELTRAIVADLSDPDGVLPGEDACIESRSGGPPLHLLRTAGRVVDEPWTPLRRDLAAPIGDCGLRVEMTQPGRAEVRVAAHRAAFEGSTFTVGQWHTMAAGPVYGDARCLVGYDAQKVAVAAVTVWSAGPGRPGMIEPLGTHRDHRGRGHGRAITLAAADGLRKMGSSSAVVCTPSANVAGVAAYVSADFEELPQVRDLRRPG